MNAKPSRATPGSIGPDRATRPEADCAGPDQVDLTTAFSAMLASGMAPDEVLSNATVTFGPEAVGRAWNGLPRCRYGAGASDPIGMILEADRDAGIAILRDLVGRGAIDDGAAMIDACLALCENGNDQDVTMAIDGFGQALRTHDIDWHYALAICGNLWQLGKPACREFAEDLAQRHIESYAGETKRFDGDTWSRMEDPIRNLVNADSAFANAVLAGMDGLDVPAGLDLSEMSGLTALPRRLSIDGPLRLDGCSGLRSIPEGLSLNGFLCLVRCGNWDGQIPADADIGGKVKTNLHPEGVTLDKWRKLHPGGEVACQ